LTRPFARPIVSSGWNVRARSKPTIEAGPPAPVTQTSTTSSHSGARPGQSSTTVQTNAMAATTPNTMCERW
jgi:hypothetical protein